MNWIELNCQHFITFATSNDNIVHMLIYISRITNNIKFYIIDIIIQPEFRLSKNFTPDRKCNKTHSRAGVRYCEAWSVVNCFWYSKILILLYLLWYELYSFYSIFSFMCMFCRSLFVLLYFFFWPLICVVCSSSIYRF